MNSLSALLHVSNFYQCVQILQPWYPDRHCRLGSLRHFQSLSAPVSPRPERNGGTLLFGFIEMPYAEAFEHLLLSSSRTNPFQLLSSSLVRMSGEICKSFFSHKLQRAVTAEPHQVLLDTARNYAIASQRTCLSASDACSQCNCHPPGSRNFPRKSNLLKAGICTQNEASLRMSTSL